MNEPAAATSRPSSLPPASSAAAVSQPPLSQVERLVDVFYAPSKTFVDIRRNASWWLPFLLSIMVGYAFTFAVEKKIGWERVVENTIQQSPQQQARFASMPADQAAQTKKAMTAGFRYFSYAFPVLSIVFALAAAAVLLGTVNFLFGGRARFGQMLAVYYYALFPLNLKYILATIVIFAGMQPEGFRLQNPVGTNLGFFLSPDTSPWLMALAMQIGIFTVWGIVLLSIGSAIVGSIKKSQAAAGVIGWWLLMTICSVGWAAMSS